MHWDLIDGTKLPEETSWYQPHFQTSLDWISNAARDRHVSIIATFGPEGPQKCSGLETKCYDAESLYCAMGPDFRLV